MKPLIIAIDGPSGSGKSTLGRKLARELNLLYIDTGAMYRAAALAVKESAVSVDDEIAIAEVVSRARIDLAGDPDAPQVILNGEDVSNSIRTEEISHLASVVSTISEVRRALVAQQRAMGSRGVVMDGRDIGTVVFPNADVKFFLTGSPEVRAQRRFEEDKLKRAEVTYEETLSDINARDHRDTTRDDSPLVAANDAVTIDTTGLSIDQVSERMQTEIRNQQANYKI
jgi:cytidylate kinase